MSKKPWLKFDAEAWLSDPHLRMCSPAAQGLLINLMAIAHGANPYGYLVNGTLAINEQNIGKIMAWNRQTVGKAWAELVLHGRTVEAECGLWYIPRMVKDNEESAKHSANGAKGGNPSLLGVNPPLKAEKRERREEKKREDTKGETSPSNTSKKPFGEFKNVKLTADELQKLRDIHGDDTLKKGICCLGDWMQSTGKSRKDHYACLKSNSWVWARVKDDERTKNTDQSGSEYREVGQ